MLQRVLVPLDGSETAEAILGQVRTLLRHKDLEAILLRAVGLPETSRGHHESLGEELHREAERYLKSLAARLEDQGARVRTELREGPAAERILEAGDQLDASLIAMSTHGLTGIARWLLGSVTEKVIRASSRPVLVMRSFRAGDGRTPERWGSEEHPFRRILVPIDGSDPALGVVAPVTELAGLFQSTLLFLHVVPHPVYAAGPFSGGPAGRPIEPQGPGDRPSAEELLRSAAETLKKSGRTVQTFTEQGDPASRILEVADRWMADLIAMSTHGRSGLSRWVLGSVTEKVLRASTKPMLIVRSVGR